MKALKNDSSIYTGQIISAITDCYSKNTEPSNGELMKLYAFIGQNICEQGEKAFVVHLAQVLAEQLSQIKGFSPRNLRRMRDFYRTYENQPELMHKAQTLGWTQNTVILECCENNEQRAFYICLAAEQNLSKLALVKAIETGTFEPASAEQNASADLGNACPAVGNDTEAEAVDTTSPTEKPCGAFVTACEPLRQGSGLHISNRSGIKPQYGLLVNDGMSSEHFLWNVQIHTVVFYAQTLCLCGLGQFLFTTHAIFQKTKKCKFSCLKILYKDF